jgi:hypothetical protein
MLIPEYFKDKQEYSQNHFNELLSPLQAMSWFMTYSQSILIINFENKIMLEI